LRVRAIGVTRVGATATGVILDEYRRRAGLEAIVVAAAGVPGGY